MKHFPQRRLHDHSGLAFGCADQMADDLVAAVAPVVRRARAATIPALLLAWAAIAGAGPAMAETVGRFDTESGMWSIERNTAKVVEAGFTFWRGGWDWVGPDIKGGVAEKARRYTFAGRHEQAKFAVSGEITAVADGVVRYRIRAREEAGGANDIYGGIIFRISTDAIRSEGFDPKPVIGADGKSWSLEFEPGKPPLTVTFDKPIARLEFEMGNLGELRAYLLDKNGKHDDLTVEMTMTFPGQLQPGALERLAARSESWRDNDLHWNRTPVDLSFLNAAERPAGKRGFLRSIGEDFVFEDGTKARFWGTNLSGYSIFQFNTPETVRQQAKRLAGLGFNLVRFHHHDSHWVEPNIFERRADHTRALNELSLERLHWWVKALKDEGIYSWIDLHVGREVTANDGIEAFDEMAKGQPRAIFKGFNYVNPTVQQRMKEFAEAFLGKVNPHTGLALKDDPAVVAVLLTNENDVSHHFGNNLLPVHNLPWHNERYLSQARAFAATYGLDADRVWRSWEFGPSKLFLADLEHRFFTEMTSHLRSMGVKAPIVGTNSWGEMTLSGLPSLAAADFIDVHSYGRGDEVSYNPRFRSTFVSWIGAAAVAGKPLTVSEWDAEPFPVFDRYQMPVYLAAMASLQGWDGLLQYAYAHGPLTGPNGPNRYQSYNDPAMIAMMPAAALLYRGNHLREPESTYYLDLPKETFLETQVDPKTSRALRTTIERGKLRIAIPEMAELPWSKATAAPAGSTVVTDPGFDAIGADVTEVCSEAGALCRNWGDGMFRVDTAQSKIAAGWVGGRKIAFDDVEIAVSAVSAAVAVQSLEDAPIAASRRVLISVAAQSIPKVRDRLPFISEPVLGEIRVRAQPGLSLANLHGDGTRERVAVDMIDGWYVVRLSERHQGSWWLLE